MLVFGRNHALMPVTIQVAWVENCLFQHVHFSMRVIGTLINLTWLRWQQACYIYVLPWGVSESKFRTGEWGRCVDIRHQIAGTSKYWNAQVYSGQRRSYEHLHRRWWDFRTNLLLKVSHSAQYSLTNNDSRKQRWGVVGDDHVTMKLRQSAMFVLHVLGYRIIQRNDTANIPYQVKVTLSIWGA